LKACGLSRKARTQNIITKCNKYQHLVTGYKDRHSAIDIVLVVMWSQLVN